MTQYTVVWLNDAEEDLAAMWLEATDRGAITRAATDIDRTLSWNADQMGDEIHEGLRRLTVLPLQVYFHVLEEDRRVEIARVLIGRRRSEDAD